MQYSPKLKKAMEEIKMILLKYDIGAMVVLHTPGHSEYLLRIDPSYSCAKFEGDSLIRVKAKLKEDFFGNKEMWTQKVTDTSNMLTLLSEVAMRQGLSLADISKIVDEKVNAEHSGGDHTSHNQQNN
jgi:hypothetical protein